MQDKMSSRSLWRSFIERLKGIVQLLWTFAWLKDGTIPVLIVKPFFHPQGFCIDVDSLQSDK